MVRKIRVRLHFSNSLPQYGDLGKYFMLLIDKEHCPTVMDVKTLICKRFGFNRACKLTLLIDGFQLMSEDQVDVIRDDEMLVVCSKVEEQLPASDKLPNESEVMEQESIEASQNCVVSKEAHSPNSNQNNQLKCDEREAINVKEANSPNSNQNNELKSVESGAMDVFQIKIAAGSDFSQIRKHKKRKKDKNVDKEKFNKKSANVSQVRAIEENTNISVDARKSKKKKVRLNEDDCVIICDDKSENIYVQNTKVVENVNKSKKKKSSSKDDRKHSDTSDSNRNVLENKNSLICETEVPLNNVKNQVKSMNIDHRQDEKQEDDVGFRTWLSGSASARNNYIDVDQQKENRIDYTSLPHLCWPPRVGDVIAFKTMQLAEDYSPYITDYMESTVINFTGTAPNSALVELKMKSYESLERRKNGRFEMNFEEEDEGNLCENCVTTTTLAWNKLIEPRLI